MRGNKFITKIILTIAILLGVASIFAYIPTSRIDKVMAEDNSVYNADYVSQKYEDGVIFSVEQVYYSADRTKELKYSTAANAPSLSNIKSYGVVNGEANNYFANFGGTSLNTSKHIIRDNEYVMLDEKTSINAYQANIIDDGSGNTSVEYSEVSLTQGVMITLGGYIYDNNSKAYFTNSQLNENTDDVNDYYASKLKSVNMSFKKNGKSVDASLRTYYLGAELYFDFVYFIDAKEENEGHYELEMTYTLQGQTSVSRNFDFYVLLSSSYTKLVEVEGNSYSSAPILENAELLEDTINNYSAKINITNYPTLTYDYMHYDLSYSYSCNELISTVNVRYGYNEITGGYGLYVTTETNGVTSEPEFFGRDKDNSIVTFVFANIGKYVFNFNYVYYYLDERLAVDNLSIDQQSLEITGYSAEYQKNGFASADMRKVEIVKNGTMVVPVGAYEISNTPEVNATTELGYAYELVSADSNQKTGTVKNVETIDFTNLIGEVTTTEEIDANSNNVVSVSEKSIFFERTNSNFKFLDVNNIAGVEELTFINTDQGGVWFNLNNLYDLSNSYYVYSTTKFKTSSDNTSYNYVTKSFTKTTTFVDSGYYFVKLSYKLTTGGESYSQFFAFRLSSAVANAKLYTTDDTTIPENVASDINRLYSNQYTNKNVYARWDEPNIFESKQTAVIYYASAGNNVYQTKDALLAFAEGQTNHALTSDIFNKDSRIVSANGSYLLKISIDNTQTKTYIYFVIDKESISGIEILGVSSAQLGDTLVYEVAKDANNNPVTYTDKALIDKTFTLWWDNKASGAEIVAKYTFTPITYDANNNEEISRNENGNNYLWLTTKYTLGSTSSDVKIEKPSTKLSLVNSEYALTNQGIYWFTLTDSAGNTISYMIVIDKTEINIKATSENVNNINSGDMVSEAVTFEWGTHKAIKLNNELKDTKNIASEDTAWAKIYRQFINGGDENYYVGTNSNLDNVSSIVKTITSNSKETMYFVVENNYATITSYNGEYKINSDGSTSTNGGSWTILTKNNSHNITLGLTSQENSYTLRIYGQNQFDNNDSDSYFVIVLNADKSEGVVMSKANENSSEDYHKVYSYNDVYNENSFNANYLSGQATDDGIVVFEWNSGQGTEFEVGSVYYDYYPLMTQNELNNFNAESEEFKYYPYSSNSTRYYIYGGEENAQNYIVTTSNGKTICRSNVLNLGYVLYYDVTGNLVSMNATLPGMYVITREYVNDTKLETDAKERKYVFFVDRNNIIEYSTTNVSLKTVGEYIGILSQETVNFNNFTQSIDTLSIYQNDVKVSANVYLESNRLPLQFKVPTGKYASMSFNNTANKYEIVKTSNSLSAGLKFNIYFVDTYGYLGMGAGISFKLFAMEDMAKHGNAYITKGYITYSLTQELLYQGENNHSSRYLSACKQTGSDWLSLPGGYVLEICDNVGSENSSKNVYDLEDCNKFLIGVKVNQQKPIIDLYANQDASDNTNAEYAEFDENNTIFSSNKAYIRYELPYEDKTSLNAQIDSSYIVITRENNGVEETYYSSVNNTGVINRDTQFVYNGMPIKYIQEYNNKLIVWLDTGLEIIDGQIVDYKEYTYNIKVRYILGENNKYQNAYLYNKLNENGVIFSTVEYYENEFNLTIDRTASLENLGNILNFNASQIDFIESYLNYYADEEFDNSGKLNSEIYNTVAYRGQDGEDYYAVVNKLYYYYVDKGDYQSAQNAMYAINVDKNANINLDNKIYYRQLFMDTDNKNNRMALLPICDTYFQNVIGFTTFSSISISSFNLVTSTSTDKTWSGVFGNIGTGYYEIIEVDECGNYTQYIIYYNNSDSLEEIAENANPSFNFKDVASSYDVSFDFLKKVYDDNGELVNLTNESSVSILKDGEPVTVFSLYTFRSVIDMFGNEASLDTSTTDLGEFKFVDWYYKVELSYANDFYVYYLNRNNLDLAGRLKTHFEKFTNQNYSITITNRFNQSLTLAISTLGQDYNLSEDNLMAEFADGKWIITPNALNFSIGEGVNYYVSRLNLKDLTDASAKEQFYEFDKNGTIINSYYYANEGIVINKDIIGANRIVLVDKHEYLATFVDCAGKEYSKLLYAYENAGDFMLYSYGNSSTVSNVTYTANPVVIKYNKNIYAGNQQITIVKDGVQIYNGSLSYENGAYIIIGGVKYVERVFDETNSSLASLVFYPYLDEVLSGIANIGALLEIKVDLIFNDMVQKTYNFVIDNRISGISLINASGEDKTDIIEAKYYYSNNIDSVINYTKEQLFALAPNLTLSETVVLGWAGFNISNYIDSNNIQYYNANIKLIEFISSDDVNVTNLTANTNKYLNISPKEMSLGRYVLIIELLNQNDEIISYKAFAFNISSTANAMYEVQDSSGEKVDYNSSIKGSELAEVFDLGVIYTKFDFLAELPDGFNDLQLAQYNNYVSFLNQIMPLYISNDGLNVVPNGDNGIQTMTWSFYISDEYTLHLYKVYSNVHSTYLCILKVVETQELINTADTSTLRYVLKSSNTPNSLVTSSEEIFSDFGVLYFSDFYSGSIASSNQKLSIARKNKLYIEVYYQYATNNASYVGKFEGTDLIIDGIDTYENYLEFSTAGTYLLYLKDLSGNVRKWNEGTANESDYLTLTVLPEVIITMNDEVAVDYAYFNDEVTVAVAYINAGYYDNGSVKMYAYCNGSETEYITTAGGKKTNLINAFTFKEYGTYRVVIEAKRNGQDITKTVVFSIINPYEARLAIDFTSISKYEITGVKNASTGSDVTSIFNFLINEGFIYSKLITYNRLSAENAFGSTMGKQTFEVFYTVNNDKLSPSRNLSFAFTINNQTPSLQSSLTPGKSTTKNIEIKFNPQTIYRQVGDCHIVINDTTIMTINSSSAFDGTNILTLSDVGKYYVKIVSDSGRVLSSFQVEIKEPLNTWSIILIVGAVLLVVAVIVTFILLRTKMRVR